LNNGLSTGWGLSVLVDGRILFDTGENGEYLFNNLKIMNVDASKIEAVVISHDHWDHTGGLWDLLKKRPGIKVYSCPGFSPEFKDNVRQLKGALIEAEGLTKIEDNILTTGEIAGMYKSGYMPEQALVLKTENGISVLTGCAHPGIVDMLYLVRKHFPEDEIYFAGGGFHLMSAGPDGIKNIISAFRELEVRKAAPCHCSGSAAERAFKKEYGADFVSFKAGAALEL
jgi:7,8-dihydropterin-6-yl-methyl-4-(beta-D-ribofuranosyl)aminobenzene 5'-phosphate synthase